MPYLPLVILGLLHGVVDCYATMIPPLWNPLETTHSLGGRMGFVIAAVQLPASFGQALFGLLADRLTSRWLTIVGATLAALGIGLAGLAPDRTTALILLAISATGVGLFHPEAVTLASRVVGQCHPKAIGIFLGCGFLGQAIGPVWISYVVDPDRGRSLADTWRTMPIGLSVIAVGAVAMALIPRGVMTRHSENTQAVAGQSPQRRRTLWLLVLMSVTKSMGIMMMLYFLPQLQLDQVATGWWMGIYIAAQSVGILLGGWTASIRQQRAILMLSLVVGLVPAAALVFTAGVAVVEPILLAIYGLCVAWSIPATIQLGQAIAPGRERLVSGLMIGFSWGSAMVITAPLADWVGAQWSSASPAYAITTGFTLVSLFCAMALPRQSALTKMIPASPAQPSPPTTRATREYTGAPPG